MHHNISRINGMWIPCGSHQLSVNEPGTNSVGYRASQSKPHDACKSSSIDTLMKKSYTTNDERLVVRLKLTNPMHHCRRRRLVKKKEDLVNVI